MNKKISNWLKRNFKDKYVIQAKNNNFRSRAWFKLDEIQKKDKLFKNGINIIDLGSAPGGWSKYASKQIGNKGYIFACDILSMLPISGVTFIKGNCTDELTINKLMKNIGNKKIQLVMSDIAPNITGISSIDNPKSIILAQSAFKIADLFLEIGGNFLVKIFMGEDFSKYLKNIKSIFQTIKIRKPNASYSSSKEVYIVAIGFLKKNK